MHAATVYVNAAATPPGDGLTWGTAYTDLQSALGAAVSSDEIWVAQGTYKPTSGTDQTATFQLVSGVPVYGGFDGTETMLSHRDWVGNVTTLSGDIGFFGDTSDNSYHVVTGSGNDATAVLDGFTATLGRATGGGVADVGAGMLVAGGSPTVTHMIFFGNVANTEGGGMWSSGSPLLTNVTFSENASGDKGGGLWDSGGVTLENVTFSNNQVIFGTGGAGMFSSGGATLTNVTFSGNSFTPSTGTFGGGMYIDFSSPTLTNVTFGGNSAETGGGIFNDSSSPTVVNAVFWGNTATTGPQIHNGPGSPTISFSLVEGGLPAGSIDLGSNIFVDPLFRNAGNLRLSVTSPGIDVGNDAANSSTTDPDGLPRKNGTIDMGAYEFTCPSGVMYVDKDVGFGVLDGLSWNGAFTDLQYSLFVLGECGGISEIWVAEGTYFPTTDGSRDSTFQLILNGVAFYGGFDASETLLSQRD
ncbi:MAG: right-handed parallel beta-helix repeat-containing protein [Candidatus Krumholzibacteria bacterium]|nr:right-handed parallel beta-helix repeat-containing protein [Candidatus Krumholzibacteria bacterium]